MGADPTLALRRTPREVRQALRGLRRAPAFTATTTAILALGIGMATAMFAVLDAVLLRPLPVREPDRVVLPRALDPGGVDVGMTEGEIRELGAASRTLEEVAGVAHQGAFTTSLMDGDRMLALQAAWVTGDFFELLDVSPVLGRLFVPGEEVPTGSTGSPVVLSYDTWQRRFGGDSTVIGRRLGNPYTHEASSVVGVAPPGLAYPPGTEYWTPVVYPILDAVARLAPGASPEAARSEFRSIIEEIDRRRAAAGTGSARLVGADIRTFTQAVLGDVRPQLLVLAAAAALLLLVACVDVGNMVLLRSTRRRAELALRRSLGATVADLLRPLLWESVALAVAGGALGVVCADALLHELVRRAPPGVPRLDVLGVSGTPLAAAVCVTLVAVLLATSIPALLSLRGGLASPLRSGPRAGPSGRSRRRLRQGLVASQVALALVMLAGAGLLVRSLDHLTSVDLGYRPDHLSIITLAKPVDGESSAAPFEDLFEHTAPALRAVPGVTSLTPIITTPFYGPQVFTARWAPGGQSEAGARANALIPFEVGGKDYFRTFQIPLLRGRGFRETDGAGAPRVAVVSQAVAERFWPGENPVGRRLRVVGDTAPAAWLTVVGEAGDIRFRSLREPTPTIYLPWRQWFFQGVLALRTTSPLPRILPTLRRTVEGVDPEATIARAETVERLVADQLAVPRLSTFVISGFGLAALLLAAAGLYGVVASTVRERTRELGIRAALGATPARQRRAVLLQAASMTAWGALAGIVGDLVALRFLRPLLFGIRPIDPVSLLGACGLLLAVALGAAWGPARRATHADPARALRTE